MCRLAVESNQMIRTIKPLKLAIGKVRPSSDALTPIHPLFVRSCLLSKCYKMALAVLEEEIYDISEPALTGLTTKDFLLYYYYGGMIYTGLKQYKKALGFFRMAVSIPASVLSSIMVEGYKKYILLSLLVYDKILTLPRYSSSILQRHHKTAFPQYQEFASAFISQNTNDLHKCAEAHCDIFQKDNNFGLIKQCIQALYRKNIQRHTQTYITLSLQDIAKSVKLPSDKDAEKHVLQMIENGEIFASINQKDGMVSFGEDLEQYDNDPIRDSLDKQIQNIIDLGKKVHTVEESIASTTEFIQKTLHERVGRWGPDFDELGADDRPGSLISQKFM